MGNTSEKKNSFCCCCKYFTLEIGIERCFVSRSILCQKGRCLPLRRSFQENSFSFNLTQTFLSKNLMQSWGCRKANRFWLLLNWRPLQTSFIHHSDMKENFAMNISKSSKIRKCFGIFGCRAIIASLQSDL